MKFNMNVKNLLKQRFGRLIVQKYIGTKHTSAYWLCKCDCGKLHKADSKCLTTGGVKSCGCLKIETDKQNRLNKRGTGQGPLNLLYCQYKWFAKKRHLKFELSKEEFKKLVLAKCVYCNCSPKRVLYSPNDYYPKTLANGVDRVNNNIGYLFKNCVPCCKQCNQAKSDFTLTDFYRWIKRIYRKKYEI